MKSNETADIPVRGIEELVFEVKDLDRSITFSNAPTVYCLSR